jgi:hypothetical protein
VAAIAKADPSMFEEIHDLLQDFRNPRLTKDDWRHLFTHGWNKGDEPNGFVLAERGKIVGFIATIFSERVIEGTPERFCNLSSWIVKPEFRSESVRLLAPALAFKNCTLINLSPERNTVQLFLKLGFSMLDTKARIILPLPAGHRSTSVQTSVTTDPEVVERTLHGHDLAIFTAHRPYRCGHVLALELDGSYCYAVFTRILRNSMYFNHVHYISSLAVFLRNLGSIRSALRRHNGAWFLLVDNRLLDGARIPLSINYGPPSASRMYRSTHVPPGKIDNLYSELILLNI